MIVELELYRFEGSFEFFPNIDRLNEINKDCTVKSKILKGIYEIEKESLVEKKVDGEFYGCNFTPHYSDSTSYLETDDYVLEQNKKNYKIISDIGIEYILYKFEICKEAVIC